MTWRVDLPIGQQFSFFYNTLADQFSLASAGVFRVGPGDTSCLKTSSSPTEASPTPSTSRPQSAQSPTISPPGPQVSKASLSESTVSTSNALPVVTGTHSLSSIPSLTGITSSAVATVSQTISVDSVIPTNPTEVSTGSFVETSKKSSMSTGTIVGVAAGSAVLALLAMALLGLFIKRRRMKVKESHIVEPGSSQDEPHILPFQDSAAAPLSTSKDAASEARAPELDPPPAYHD
ncbi:hypothetical protein HGRIS_010588 [Hohenbuehelia grisea]